VQEAEQAGQQLGGCNYATPEHSLELLHVSMSVGVIIGSTAYTAEPKHASSNSRRIMLPGSSNCYCLLFSNHVHM
jgi:hypothetical protein